MVCSENVGLSIIKNATLKEFKDKTVQCFSCKTVKKINMSSSLFDENISNVKAYV